MFACKLKGDFTSPEDFAPRDSKTCTFGLMQILIVVILHSHALMDR